MAKDATVRLNENDSLFLKDATSVVETAPITEGGKIEAKPPTLAISAPFIAFAAILFLVLRKVRGGKQMWNGFELQK